MPPEQKPIRKLRAILSADAKGYSLLMADDEAFTIKILKEYRDIMSMKIERYNGRVVDSPGDNLLAEFSSVLDAVECAVEIQKKLKKENERFVDDKRLQFRIGLNIGDIVQDGNRIYGSGVNVAARIEGLAEPGGICISRSAYDQVKDNIDLEFEYLGEQKVKNVKDPVRVYKVFMASEPSKTLIDEPLELSEKPSIAVLPFSNMSGDPNQEYIGDAFSENIITSLSKIGRILVIARNSSFIYKNRPVKIQQVAKELSVRYVLEGSFQKSANRIRINAQLIDALNGHHLWSEKYDRELDDLFDLQDEITNKIVLSLHIELTRGEAAFLEARSTNSIEAWINVAKGYDFCMKLNKEDNYRARSLYETATALDPSYASAWAWLSLTYILDMRYKWSKNSLDQKQIAEELFQKSLSLDDKDPIALLAQGQFLLYQREHEKAVNKLKECLAYYPNHSGAFFNLSIVLHYAGRFDESIEMIKNAIRFCPYYPALYLKYFGASYLYIGKYKQAIAIFNEFTDRCKKGDGPLWFALLHLAWCHEEMGHHKEASSFILKVLELNPGLTIENLKDIPFKNPGHLQRFLSALNKAGLS